MEDILNIIKKNSINESTVSADMSDVDEIVSAIIDQKRIDSLAYQICDVQPIHGPTGGIFGVTYDTVNDKTVLKRTNVTTEADSTLNTGFTQEVVQDMQTQFGKDTLGFVSKSFSGISNIAENTKLFSKMSTWAANDGTLTLQDVTNAELNVFQIAQKVAENVIKINSITYRTMDAWAILPQKAAAAFLGLSSYFSDDVNESGLFISRTSRIKYYVNPDPLATEVYVGVKGKMPGNSSVIFSPYQYNVISAIDPDTGNTNVFSVNRYAITLSPLSEVGNEMIRKFTVA